MTDPHGRFFAWLPDRAQGEPPRDLAVHAALCPTCMAWVAAHDALHRIDVGRAPLPPSHPTAIPRPAGLSGAGRVAAAAGVDAPGWRRCDPWRVADPHWTVGNQPGPDGWRARGEWLTRAIAVGRVRACKRISRPDRISIGESRRDPTADRASGYGLSGHPSLAKAVNVKLPRSLLSATRRRGR